jgi:elongation factor Ts
MSTTIAISAADVNNLRKKTGGGMMDCKKALTEANGDFEKAIEILRKKGQKIAANRSDREASEGVVLANTTSDNKVGTVLTLNCETDFVAKNEDFISLATKISNIATSTLPTSVEELMALPYDSTLKISEVLLDYIGKIGEKIEISKYDVVRAEYVCGYTHPGNRIASIVGLNKAGEKSASIAKDVAMQIAAMNPIALDKDDVSKDTIEKEIEIGKEQARTEGKPEEMLEKIALGKLNKFYNEATLLNQEFIKDNKKTVRQYVTESDKELTITGFKRQSLS